MLELSRKVRVSPSNAKFTQGNQTEVAYNGAIIAYDTNTSKTAHSPSEFTLGHNVSSKEEVDAVMEQAKKAGAKIVKPAQETFWGGYAGYFQDPDEHFWEVAWNPQLLPE